MSSKSSKRVSVFDRLGPGNDDSTATHRRYSSEKHTSASQDKGRSHAYGQPVPVRMEERKTRHRSALEYSGLTEVETLDDKRTPNPPPMKSSRDPEGMKSINVKVGRASLGSAESDSYDTGEVRKAYHDVAHRSKHGVDILEESRGSRLKDKTHAHSDRTMGHRSSPTMDTVSKSRPRREGVAVSHDHRRHKEEEAKTPSELVGHKRRRDHLDDLYLPETKKSRHSDHAVGVKETDRHYRDADRSYGKDTDHSHGNSERKRRQEPSSETSSKKHSPRSSSTGDKSKGSKGHRHSSRESKKSDEKEHNKASGSSGGGGGGGRSKTLDWTAVCNYNKKFNSKLAHYPRPSLSRFRPGAVFAGLNVTLDLAGPEYYQRVMEAVSTHLKEEEDSGMNSHQGGVDSDEMVLKYLGACRRALTASDDYSLRRELKKTHQDRDFVTSRQVQSNWPVSEHYSLALELYQHLPTKSTGKPAFRQHPSRVGTLIY